jgi:DNA-binding response OmpR family regulator
VRILLIEDEPNAARFLAKGLRGAKHAVDTYEQDPNLRCRSVSTAPAPVCCSMSAVFVPRR